MNMKRLPLSRLFTVGIALTGFTVPVFAEDAKKAANTAKTGQPAPGFTLESSNKKQVSLSGFRGKKNVILIFSRANW